MKIWYSGLHLALVTCYYPNLSKNGSRLKKSVKNLSFASGQNWSIFSIFNFLKKCLTLRGCSIQTTYPQKIKGYQWKDNVHIFNFMPSSILCQCVTMQMLMDFVDTVIRLSWSVLVQWIPQHGGTGCHSNVVDNKKCFGCCDPSGFVNPISNQGTEEDDTVDRKYDWITDLKFQY